MIIGLDAMTRFLEYSEVFRVQSRSRCFEGRDKRFLELSQELLPSRSPNRGRLMCLEMDEKRRDDALSRYHQWTVVFSILGQS